MKAVRIVLVALVFMMMSVAGAFAVDFKVGVIDFQRVLKESKGGKAAKADIEKKGTTMEKSLKQEGEEIENLKKKLEAESMVMSKDKQDEKERDFRIKVSDFKSMQKKYAREIRDYEGEIIKKVQKDVFEIIDKIGKEGTYQLILEKAAVLYYPNAIDITDELIKRYDAKK